MKSILKLYVSILVSMWSLHKQCLRVVVTENWSEIWKKNGTFVITKVVSNMKLILI